MAKPGKPQGNPKSNKKPPVYSQQASKTSLFDGLNAWAEKRSKALTIIIFASCALFSILLFQAKMDLGADDSAYLQRAYDFIHKGMFPSYQGALYPMLLGLFIAVFGINIILLKVISIIFNFLALYFMYKAFKKRVPAFLLYVILFLTAFNTFMLNYASLTYSEPFFMFIQSLVLFYFFKLNDSLENKEDKSLRGNYHQWLTVGLCVFLLATVRTIGFFSFGAFIVYFLIRKQYKYILYLVGAFLVFQIPMMLLEKVIWHVSSDGNSQAKILLLKNPYDPSEGNETLNGFVVRFTDNCVIYLSKRFFQIINIRSSDSTDQSGGITFFFIAFCLFSIYRIFRSKNYPMLLTGLYTMCMLSASFFAIQTRWDQPRIIMVYVPLMLLVVLYGLYDILKKAPWGAQVLMLLAVVIPLAIASVSSTVKAVKINSPILSKNLHGDIYYGYTPDWVNYLKMSKWCADNLPKDAKVATRKASMSFVYGNGKEFFAINRAYYTDPDSVLGFFKRNNVGYVMLASLRMNPNVADEHSIINTVHQMMVPVAQKYPQKLKLVHQEGDAEPAYLYQIVN
jgi:hypothetical protein